MTTVFVTGASGALGQALIQQLSDTGLTVIAGSRTPKQQPGVQAVAFDYDRPQTFETLKGVDKLVMIPRPGDVVADQVMIPVIEAAKAAGVKQIVLSTALGVDANEEAPLRKVEQALFASGLDYTVVRPSWFFDNFLKPGEVASIRQGVLVAPASDGKASFIAARDIAAAIVAALLDSRHNGAAYTLTGPQAVTHAEVAAALSSALGHEVSHLDIAPVEYGALLAKAGLTDSQVGFYQFLYELTRVGVFGAVTSDLEAVTGRPGQDLAGFVAEHHAAWP
ncbi:NAD(P)H-binding protein [Halomonas denitrificans]|nr:NAD(P)H-binding protein [Halomonas denitrificans]